MRFSFRAHQPMSDYVSSLADAGHANRGALSRKLRLTVIPLIQLSSVTLPQIPSYMPPFLRLPKKEFTSFNCTTCS